MESEGVSVIICTYNGSTRLGTTVEHLAKQAFTIPIPWEILLIDNNSSDNTFEYAQELKSQYPFLSFHVLQEIKKGKIHAINLGIRQSKYDCLIICDDDCWLNPIYLETAYFSLKADPQIGVINGSYENIFDSQIPFWFKEYEQKFASNHLGEQRIDITDTLGTIWGAGMVLNKKAYQHAQKLGFENFLSGGQGQKRLAGEDTEICLVLRLLGYKIIYEPKLSFKHFMPASRITWQTIREINQANGTASIFYNPYRFFYNRRMNKKDSIERVWRKELVNNLSFFMNFRTWLSYFFNKAEGNWSILRIERQLAKLTSLLKNKKDYENLYTRIELLIQKQKKPI